MVSKYLIATGCVCGAISLSLIAPGTASANATVTYGTGTGTVTATVNNYYPNGEYCRLFIDGTGQSGSGYGVVSGSSVYLYASASNGTHTAQVKCDSQTFEARQVTVTGGGGGGGGQGGGGTMQGGNEGTAGEAIENALADLIGLIFPGATGR
ncbi:hypothetical protein [Nocardia sp. NPDC046763]|uniref:hypothetical protein n=1 Tax=Nocardia sp. NPDC046763 TaxID=3155256 RepID=UPI0033C5D07B